MRNGAQILFALSALIFLIVLGQALLSLRFPMVAGQSFESQPVGGLMFLTSLLSALSSAVLPFFGALVIDRWDHRDRERSRVETIADTAS
ncbi:hypothetical protein [Glacieibacterium frigidum]|uniref:Uncharacterized protein n=1 Tax=Glacieibacterium frigidum TaxID=2593303 RepID=A0A552U8X6_9SPHN|nr:hypothetical protein [Glacieibacterium frigidum]TRW14660.1 hypothetical protein FMM06_13300 [Glacieibacterium frigidum]